MTGIYLCLSVSSCELHLRSGCPPPPQPVPLPCMVGATEIIFFGKNKSYNVTGEIPEMPGICIFKTNIVSRLTL